MKTLFAVGVLLLLCGCAPIPLGNHQIVEETRYCTDSGMDVQVVRISGTSEIAEIQCVPKNVREAGK